MLKFCTSIPTIIGSLLIFASGVSIAQLQPGIGINDLSPTPAPAWVLEIPPGHWAPVSLNTLADVDPEDDPDANPNYPNSAPWRGSSGQKSVVGAWNGGAFASKYGSHGSLILFGGGHADYYGSEIYAFDLNLRLWKRVTNPYAGPFNWPYPDAEYPDGSPVPPHTYSFAGYHPQTNSFVLLKGQDELGNVTGFDAQKDIVHMFSFDDLSWRRSGHAPNPRPKLYSGGWSVYDPVRQLFWGEGGSGGDFMVAFDPSTENGDGTFGTWVDTYAPKTLMTDTVAEYDSVNDIIVILPWRNDDRVAGIDLSRPDNDEVYLNVIGTPPAKSSQSGFSWSTMNQGFIYFSRSSGDEIYQFRHTSGDWQTGSWRWEKMTATNNQVTPNSPASGPYDRFQVISYSDAEIAIVVNGVDDPVYAFRIPRATRPAAPSDLN